MENKEKQDKRRKLSPEERAHILTLRGQNRSYNAIAKEMAFKVSPQRIAQICLMEELKVLREKNG